MTKQEIQYLTQFVLTKPMNNVTVLESVKISEILSKLNKECETNESK